MGKRTTNRRNYAFGTSLAIALAGACLLASTLRGQNGPDPRSGAPGDSTGALAGRIVDGETGQPVPYGTVLVTGTDRARFADSTGEFRLTHLVPGAYHLRARQIGYSPTDTVVNVAPGPATTTVTLRLTKIALKLAAIEVQGRRSKGCVATGVPDPATSAGLATIFAQVRENVDRVRLVLDEYPFHYALEERVIMRRDPGGDSTERIDTVTYESRARHPYRVGGVVYDEVGALAQTQRMMYLPTFRDLADPTFLSAHCFTFGGAQKLGKTGINVLRVDFKPANAIASPDVEGSVYLDAERYIVRQAVFRLTKPESVDPPLVDVTVTSTYRELMPLVPVLDATQAVQPMLPTTGQFAGQSRSVIRTTITEDRLVGYTFDSRTPGEQPASVAPLGPVPTASVTAAAPASRQTGTIEGRVLRADGTPVQGAVVSLLASTDSTTTSDSGRFTFPAVARGAHMLSFHGVGYRPERLAVTVFANRPSAVTITVAPTVPILAQVVTTGQFPVGYAQVGLDKRMQAGLGQFMTAEQIERRQAANFSQLLQTMHGIKVAPSTHQFGATAGGTRGPGSCVAYVIDGVPQTQLMDNTGGGMPQSIGPESLDNLIEPSAIGAIEVYSSAQRPAGLGTLEERPLGSAGDQTSKIDLNAQQCALVVIWTRARLGLTGAETPTAANGIRAPSTHALGTEVPKARGTAFFPAAGTPACAPPAPIDTIRLNVYGVLQSAVAADVRDSAGAHYSSRVLEAFRKTFALPSQLVLPVFGYAHPALIPGSLKQQGLAVAPGLSAVIAFTLDPTGGLLDVHIRTSSLSGSADTSVLAAVQGAAATHAFPAISAPPLGRQPLRFEVTVTTITPDPAQQVAVLDQIDVADYRLARPVELIPASYPDLMADKSHPTGPPDSAVVEMVVDENGKAVMSTVRAYTQTAGRPGDQSYRGFVARIANLLPSFRFDPAMIGTCPVRQITLQPFAN